MIRLKLNLPEATVNYDENGTLLGVPVEHTPNQIKNYSLPFEIVGYVSKSDFLAYSLYSSARKFTVAEQISLLTSLGFKTVPYFENEKGNDNQLISIKNQYSMYGAYWISLPSGTEFKVPELAHINAAEWKLGPAKTLTLVVTTDKGVFEVYDMKLIAYYQPGCTAKVWNGELQPMNTAPVVLPIPSHCPKCNNPLKRVQIYPDLPLFYKCTNSICDQLVLDEDQTKEIEPEVDTAEEQDNFLGTDTIEVEEQQVLESTVPDEAVEEAVATAIKCYVDFAKLDEALVESLVADGKIEVVNDIVDADCVLVKTKMSVSKQVRTLAKENDKELKPISEFE